MNIYAENDTVKDPVVDGNGDDGENANSSNLANRISGQSSFVRLCFQNTNGTSISCRDFKYGTKYLTHWDDITKVYKTTTPTSKAGYIVSGDTPSFNLEVNKDSVFENSEIVNKILTDNGFAEVDFSAVYNLSQINISGISQMFENWDAKKSGGKSYQQSILDVISRLSNSNPDVSEYINGDGDYNITDLSLTIETGSCWRLNGKVYCGTVNELVTKASTVKSLEDEYGCTTNGNALCNIGGRSLINYACSGYLSGNLGTDIDNDNFTTSSYFNGNISIYNSIPKGQTCQSYLTNLYDNKKISRAELAKLIQNSGLSMNVIAFQQYFETGELTCDIIKTVTGNSDTYYCEDKDHVDDILNKFNTPENKVIYGELTEDKYNSLCPCEDKEEEETPKGSCSNYKQVNTCPSSYTVKYEDITDADFDSDEYWENCIFNVGEYEDEYHKNSYIDTSLGSEYCPVYCVEDLEATFGSNYITVEAGRYFNFDQLGQSVINGTRQCRTKEIEWGQFTEDLTQQNQAIKTAYKNYLITAAKEEANNSVTKSTYKNCGGQWVLIETNQVDEKQQNEAFFQYEYSENKKYTVIKKSKNDDISDTEYLSDSCPTETDEFEYDCIENAKYTEKVYELVYTKYTYTYQLKKVSLDNQTILSGETRTSCGINNYKISKSSSEYLNDYKNLRDGYGAIVNKMEKCYDWGDSIYNLTGEATIEYYDTNYGKSQTLSGSTSYGTISDMHESIGQETFQRLECSGNTCSGGKEYEVTKYDYVLKQQSGTLTFNFNGGYQYISKGSNFSIVSPSNSEQDKVISFSHDFPISFNTTTGDYNIAINYSNLGHNGAVSTVLKGYENLGDWTCKYKVVDELFKDGELQIIYRSIDLSIPFPDIDGTGRNSGSNWTTSNITNVITNHQDIYSNKPMYTFILTPSMITKIRSYNKNNEYTDFNLSCTNGKNCISDFVTALIKQEYGANETSDGACEVNRVNYPSSNFFSSCRYQKK